MTVTYEFELEGGQKYRVEVGEDGVVGNTGKDAQHPAWTQLENGKCHACTLDAQTHPHCPVALQIERVAGTFSKILSVSRVKVTVLTERRNYVWTCDAQGALTSLYGLIMARSACPMLSRMRPLADTHLPFSTAEESLTRVVGSYLIKQHFLYEEGKVAPDWGLAGVIRLYEELEGVNKDLVMRLRAASEADSNLNAVVSFHALSGVFAIGLKDLLAEQRDLFVRGF